MLKNKKIVVVMPAYNAARTLRKTYDEVMAQEIVDHVIIVDDGSSDQTASIAENLPDATLHIHSRNRGYGANQKTCYRLALEADADIVIMVHPDYQYTPLLIPAMASLIANDLYQCVIGSRILGGQALQGGMPVWKYIANRSLTFVQNWMIGAKLSEYHTGFRAFSSQLIDRLPIGHNSDDFAFDNQMLAQIIWQGFTVAEITCPTRYFKEASSINLTRSIRYGLSCLATSLTFKLTRLGLIASPLFPR
jgi:glycosyltransferase involved in cell wall biosynthesis